MIVATAGHIDHGKTTLVRALTGVDTDRLPEEKARGISIDIGFAYWKLPDGRTIGFVDVPGHERFVRNMLSGVYAVDHLLLVIAGDDGVMPQTREHLNIAGLLAVTHATLVITKRDRVSADRLAQVEGEALELLKSRGYSDVPVIAVSAVTGEGIEVLKARLIAAAAAVRARKATAQYARYVVDRVFTAPGSGTIVTGTVISGVINTGDPLVISPSGLQARARKLQFHGEATERAAAGERCAINLANVEHTAVERGDWLVAPMALRPTDRFDARITLLAGEGRALKHWTPVHLHIGAADIPARVALRRGEAIEPGQSAFVQLRLQRPVQAANADRFILRDQSATRTIGGGIVLDPLPPARRSSGRDQVLAALAEGEAEAALKALLAPEAEGAVDLEWFAAAFNMPLAAGQHMLPADVLVLRTASHIVLSAPRVAILKEQVIARVQLFHKLNRAADGIELTKLHSEVARSLARDAFLALIKLCAPRWGLIVQGSKLRAARHDATDNPRDAQIWQRIRTRLEEAASAIPSVRELSTWSGVPLQQLRDLMHRKNANGDLVKLTLERFALPETMDALRDKAILTANGRPDGLFTAAQYRDVIGTGRTLAIEILECLDKQGATVRRGDLRAIRQTQTPVPETHSISRGSR